MTAGWNPEYFPAFSPKLVLLDLDGTLIDSVPDLATAIDHMLLAGGYSAAGQQKVSYWVGNGADMLVRRALADGDEQQANLLDKDVIAQHRQIFDKAYLATLNNATGVYPGVQVFLETLANMCIPKALITNKPRLFTEPLIESLGWRYQFADVFCGDDLSEKKPSKLPLMTACQQQDCPPETAVMIGDSRNDMLAAKAAGVFSVAVDYGYNHGESITDSEPDAVVSDLNELVV